MGSLTSLLLIFLPIFATALGAESKNSRLRKAVFANYDKLVIPDHKITLNLSMTVYYLSYCPHKQVMMDLKKI